jgi:hypothetical protein
VKKLKNKHGILFSMQICEFVFLFCECLCRSFIDIIHDLIIHIITTASITFGRKKNRKIQLRQSDSLWIVEPNVCIVNVPNNNKSYCIFHFENKMIKERIVC